jgi:hypothetical protein
LTAQKKVVKFRLSLEKSSLTLQALYVNKVGDKIRKVPGLYLIVACEGEFLLIETSSSFSS